jgi:hypothetical protein
MTVYSFANAPEEGSMGVWGYVASGDDAQLEVDDQAAGSEILVSRVASPVAAWVVVHVDDDGMPGERVGLAQIAEGESTEVRVELSEATAQSVIVAVHADKGNPGEFDFDMEDAAESADRPLFVDRMELAEVVQLQ